MSQQFGTQGVLPPNWHGTGTMTGVSDSVARYTDDGGTVVIFHPASTPGVQRVEHATCD